MHTSILDNSITLVKCYSVPFKNRYDAVSHVESEKLKSKQSKPLYS